MRGRSGKRLDTRGRRGAGQGCCTIAGLESEPLPVSVPPPFVGEVRWGAPPANPSDPTSKAHFTPTTASPVEGEALLGILAVRP